MTNTRRITISESLLVEVERLPSGVFVVEKFEIVSGGAGSFVGLSERPISPPVHQPSSDVVQYIIDMRANPPREWIDYVKTEICQMT